MQRLQQIILSIDNVGPKQIREYRVPRILLSSLPLPEWVGIFLDVLYQRLVLGLLLWAELALLDYGLLFTSVFSCVSVLLMMSFFTIAYHSSKCCRDLII